MKISPQDNARIVVSQENINQAILDKARENREVQNKSTLEDQVAKSRIEQKKFMNEQYQTLLDGIYSEKARQNAVKMKGTNVDIKT
jgi:hypothetical protein